MSVYFFFTEYDSVGDAVKDWAIIVALVISFIALPLVGSLAGYHFYLVVSNQTTNEDLNEVYAKEPNPFTMGRMKNLCTILCARQRPTRLVAPKKKGGVPGVAWGGAESSPDKPPPPALQDPPNGPMAASPGVSIHTNSTSQQRADQLGAGLQSPASSPNTKSPKTNSQTTKNT